MVTMTVTQKVKLGPIQPLDKQGNPATVDGVPKWASSDPAILAIQPVGTDGMAVTIFANGTLGNAQITCTCDADLGEGTKEITGITEFSILGGEAVSLSVPVGTPEEQQTPVGRGKGK